MSEDERKSTVIIEYLDAAVESFERALAHADPATRKSHLRSAIYHWFSTLYDEGRAYRFDLISSLSALTEQVSRLKKRNRELLERLSRERRR